MSTQVEPTREWTLADFLDAETARIDSLMKGRSAQIELLEARRQVIISEEYERLLIACGGIRLRHAILGIEQGWSPQCEDRPAEAEEWGVIKAGCVNGGRFMEDQHKALPADVAPRLEYRLRPDDLLMSRASGSPDLVGSVAVVPSGVRNLLLCDKVYRIRVDGHRMRPWFFALMLRAHGNREHIKLGISGAEGMANNLPTAVVKDCLVPDAATDVQDATVSLLDRELMLVEELERHAGRQLVLLAERRQALITAAVTGEFDVTTARGVDVS
jgi:type I restriction enzyme S subunit